MWLYMQQPILLIGYAGYEFLPSKLQKHVKFAARNSCNQTINPYNPFIIYARLPMCHMVSPPASASGAPRHPLPISR